MGGTNLSNQIFTFAVDHHRISYSSQLQLHAFRSTVIECQPAVTWLRWMSTLACAVV